MKNQAIQTSVSYFHWSFRLVISLFIAWYLNTATQYRSFFILIQQRNYQEAVLFSFLMAIGVISGVHYISFYLDKYLLWEEKPILRTIAQLLFGVVAMILFTYLAVAIYFRNIGGNMDLSDYMVLEFPIVQTAIAMLNVLYLCYYLITKKLVPENHEKHLKGTLGSKSFFIPVGDILYLVRTGKEGYAVLKNNKTLHIVYKMSELEELLDPKKFFRANRSLMVSLDAVAGYKPVKNMQCVLLLRVPIQIGIDLTVTRNRTETLKRLLSQRAIKPEEGHKALLVKG
ncbi:LytTR family DNA-binding domain-containing protein [Pedobacter arcticus]|uniref:LytTR family DNA-binding domain-containing protein n=1 Tax=Pedobacter arcticus TaxID=752140 RepID=UPI00030D833F|nr:LytTR family DNA-binding domain-containing protein [Pedobacter arcticus]